MYEGCDDTTTPKKRAPQVSESEGGYPESKKVTPPKDMVTEIKAKVLSKAQDEHTSYPVEVASDVSDDMYETLMVRLEADPTWKTCRCKMALIEGRIIIIQILDEIHEIIAEQVGEDFTEFNISQPQRVFRALGSTRIRYGQSNTCLEGDKSFANRHATFSRDAKGNIIPSIVFEVANSENYESIQGTALQYLQNNNVRMVISIKILATQHQANQLYCIVHTRDENNQVIVSKVISFGPNCRSQTVEAILRHTDVDPYNFIGIGRPGFAGNQVNYPEVLNDEDVFSVMVPNEVIWWNVPEEKRFAIDQFRLRLSGVVECLRGCNYL